MGTHVQVGWDAFFLLCYAALLWGLWRYNRADSSKAQGKALQIITLILASLSATDIMLDMNRYAQFDSLLDTLSFGMGMAYVVAVCLICVFVAFNKYDRHRSPYRQLEQEIHRRQALEEQLRKASDSLEHDVAQRTRELEDIKTRLEQEVQATAQANKRMTSIFDAAPNGMLVVNREGFITQANTMVASTFRCSVEDLIGQPVDNLVPSEIRHQHVVDRQAFQDKPAKRKMGARRNLFGVRFDGSYVPVEVGLHPVELDEGTEIVAAVVDISERKAYEKRIHERNEALETSNRELQEFAFIASHDLREPLRKIISFSTLLQEGEYGEFNDEGKVFSDYIVNAAHRMRDLLTDLLAYSRVTSKANPFKAVRMNALMEEVLDDLQLAVEESHARVEVTNLPDVVADQVQLRQLFQNLIDNSLKYHDPDRSPVIRISGSEDDYFVRYEVADNGIGFHQQYADKIFEVFKRLHDKQVFTGTGMGLAICRKIVQRHSGTITASSKENVGTTMRIELAKKQVESDGQE